jgi:pimeloyl-ACP methyl ester carboxylesterase
MDVTIPCGKTHLAGILKIPASPIGIVLFAHGSGSSRFSVRNQAVARTLQQGRIATLLFDLLTKDEEAVDNLTAELRFNIPLLAQRLVLATQWTEQKHPMNIGYFGASTGAAAALIAAAELGPKIHAIVSRGGRPDLAKEYLAKVTAPTLLIAGGLDTTVIELNRLAFDGLSCVKKLEIIEGASHLFEEKGKMELVTKDALDWFTQYLS